MPTWIFAQTESLCNFLVPLLLNFSPAQQRHALNFIEALMVSGSKHKTLRHLTGLLRLPHADEFALADFFRASPWDHQALQKGVTLCLLKLVVQLQTRTGWRLLFLKIDDALCPKDVATQALAAVSLQYDHVTQRRQRGKCTNSSRYVTLSLQIGPAQFCLAWRLYLPVKVVKRLNRGRAVAEKLTYHKLVALVEQMLDEVAPQLPPACRVYVLFDAWYDNQQLLNYIRAHGWHFICATRSNRNLSGRPLCHWWPHLGYQRITRVVVRSAKRSRTYQTRYHIGQLRRYPQPVVAIISKRKQRDTHPAYFLCSDTSLHVRTILKYYGYRWQAEVDNWFLKERFGLSDFRVQSLEAILRWHTLVFAAYAFVQTQRVAPLLTDPKVTLQPLGDVLRTHQAAHVRHTVCHIAALVRSGLSDAELVAMLLPP
ncbi:MAG: transposase [Chloroflexi bacterium]|nr:transposase [Chloroflexota bacterium]